MLLISTKVINIFKKNYQNIQKFQKISKIEKNIFKKLKIFSNYKTTNYHHKKICESNFPVNNDELRLVIHEKKID